MKTFSRRQFLPLAGLSLLSASCISANSNEILLEIQKRTPKKLNKGDTIGICAPAGAIKHKSEVDDFVEILRNLGFKTKLGKHVAERYGYFSAKDEERADEFMTLIEDEEVNGIFFIRGGWGCARILEHLDFDVIKNNPKVIMGFSDITTLLNAITSRSELITFHGPGGNSTWNPYSVDYIDRILMQGQNLKFENKHYDATITTLTGGIATGELYGGNLSVLSGLIGSDYNLVASLTKLTDLYLELSENVRPKSRIIHSLYNKCLNNTSKISESLYMQALNSGTLRINSRYL